MSATGSPPLTSGCRARCAPHALEHVEQAGRVGLTPTPRDAQPRPGQQRRGDDERRRAGEVAGHVEPERLQPRGRPHLDASRLRAHARSGRAQHPLGVVSRRDRLDDVGRAASGVEPGEQDARLHLRARDRQLVANRAQRPALDREREPAAVGLHAAPIRSAARRSGPSAAR
jgi:hypothetical protein